MDAGIMAEQDGCVSMAKHTLWEAFINSALQGRKQRKQKRRMWPLLFIERKNKLKG